MWKIVNDRVLFGKAYLKAVQIRFPSWRTKKERRGFIADFDCLVKGGQKEQEATL